MMIEMILPPSRVITSGVLPYHFDTHSRRIILWLLCKSLIRSDGDYVFIVPGIPRW